MDKKKTSWRAVRDAILAALVIGALVPGIDAAFDSLEQFTPLVDGTAQDGETPVTSPILGAAIFFIYRFIRDWWKHGGKPWVRKYIDDLDSALDYRNLMFLIGFALLIGF